MGVTNFDNLPQNQAATTLRAAEQALNERKAMQRVGKSSVSYYRTNDAGSYLWSGRLDFQSGQSPTVGMANFMVNLTSSASPAFLSALVATVESSSDGVTWNQIRSDGSSNPWRMQEGSVVTAQPYVAAYEVIMTGTYMEYRRFKVQALTSDPVSISVVRTL